MLYISLINYLKRWQVSLVELETFWPVDLHGDLVP